MNVAISTAYSLASDAENGKIEITPAIPFVPESTVGSGISDKNKLELILVTCRYRSSTGASKKDNFIIQAKHYETETTEDVLCWCITLQESFDKRTL